MKENIIQLEEKLFELEHMEKQLELELLKISDEAKNIEKYRFGQLVPYSYEENVTFIPEQNISILREKSYKSYEAMPDVYRDFHSFPEYVEGHSAPHGYPDKEYDMGLNTRFSGIFFEMLLSAPLCLIGGLLAGVPVMWLTDLTFGKSFAISALAFGILFVFSMLKEKIRQNNAKEPLDDPDYLIEKAKYEKILIERNEKLASERTVMNECKAKLEEIAKAKKAVKEGIKMLKKDG